MTGHVHHTGPAKAHINETAVLLSHRPDPLSYWAYDGHWHVANESTGRLERDDVDEPRWPGLLRAHVVTSVLAYFIVWPAGIMLSVAHHPLQIPVKLVFAVMVVLSIAFAEAYKAATPDLYAGNKHGAMSWALALLTLGLTAADVLTVVRNLVGWFRSGSSWHDLPRLVLGRPKGYEEVETDFHPSGAATPDPPMLERRRGHKPELSLDLTNHVFRTISEHSVDSARSDETLVHADFRPMPETRWRRLRAVGRYTKLFFERSSILLAWACVLSGTAVYTGVCRHTYLNGCLAHMIKGSIFLWYGVLTWGRYLGAFAQYGWAWNRKPASRPGSATDLMPSAEFVESFVILLYGASNTWMERLGKPAGSPYSVKDVQHISIAVMFWFAGLMGCLLESASVRRFLSSSLSHKTERPLSTYAPPPSYAFSFNPFPALVIGVTGIAMAAHAQEYEFQVAVHSLWGVLLFGFAALRCATYAFLWLRPPASILPSRPPTEALASVSLACGGLVFIQSTEQVTFAAMRNGWDDIMAFLNVSVAIVSLAFTWVLALMALKGWAVTRMAASSPLSNIKSTPRRSSDDTVAV